jgi:ubiquinone/menaquinone biosynthesis C-methylase UbiE
MECTKQILAVLREGDFAHPGEIEAIELALSPINKDSKACVLDVGCGLGGTAHYVQKEGWGMVTGIDIDKKLIDYASSHYPEIQFVCEDILHNKLPHQSFQCIYSFSAFFCFASQEMALNELFKLAAPKASLVLFDYSKQVANPIQSPFPWSKTASLFSPIYLPELQSQLSTTGWQFIHSIDISQNFIGWYTALLQQFEQKRIKIEHRFGRQAWDTLYSGYQQLLMDLKTQKTGGIVVYASRDNA